MRKRKNINMMALFDFLGTDTLKIVCWALIYTTAKYRKLPLISPSPPLLG